MKSSRSSQIPLPTLAAGADNLISAKDDGAHRDLIGGCGLGAGYSAPADALSLLQLDGACCGFGPPRACAPNPGTFFGSTRQKCAVEPVAWAFGAPDAYAEAAAEAGRRRPADPPAAEAARPRPAAASLLYTSAAADE